MMSDGVYSLGNTISHHEQVLGNGLIDEGAYRIAMQAVNKATRQVGAFVLIQWPSSASRAATMILKYTAISSRRSRC